MNSSRIEKYCCGCGLCSHWQEGHYDSRGFFRPNERITESGFDTSVCYCNSLAGTSEPASWWGPMRSAQYSWSCDEGIRETASSGGTLTALCAYMLKSGLVDGVVQVSRDSGSQIRTNVALSVSPADVIRCAGSRYAGSAVLANLFDQIERNKRYAVVAKPCDARVLRSWLTLNDGWKDTFPYILSFFCGGTPTCQANVRLLSEMGVKEDDLADFWYRGHGWPGMATAIRHDGTMSTMEYESSWGRILGRDLQEICRFCWEGTGEAADLSCGDGWYVADGRPSFEETAGRNITLTRTEAGKRLLEGAVASGEVEIEQIEDLDVLSAMQPGQYVRKAAMFSFVLAMRLAHKETPRYSLREISRWSRSIPLTMRCRMFLGTLRRITRGKIN